MENKTKTFIFYGIVGSGKGTQLELLRKYFRDNNISDDIVFLSTGEEFRNILKTDNYTASTIKNSIENGILIPDFLTTSIAVNKISNNIKKDSIVITDGYPRTIVQSKSFKEMMDFYGRKNVVIISLELSKEEALKRMKLRGRKDDTDVGIENRFEEYIRNVIPSMQYFEDKDGYNILKIDGLKTIDEVHEEIITRIKPYI